MAEKKIFADILIETTATEESMVSSRQKGKILRRPMALWKMICCVVGLFRMTSSEDLSF